MRQNKYEYTNIDKNINKSIFNTKEYTIDNGDDSDKCKYHYN